MNRIAQYAAVLAPGSADRLEGSHPADPHLRSLLVHMAFADGQVDENEFDLLGRVVPDLDTTALLMWVDAEARRPMDLQALLDHFEDPEDRQALVDLAKQMARADLQLHAGELQLIEMLTTLVHL